MKSRKWIQTKVSKSNWMPKREGRGEQRKRSSQRFRIFTIHLVVLRRLNGRLSNISNDKLLLGKPFPNKLPKNAFFLLPCGFVVGCLGSTEIFEKTFLNWEGERWGVNPSILCSQKTRSLRFLVSLFLLIEMFWNECVPIEMIDWRVVDDNEWGVKCWCHPNYTFLNM